VTPMHNSSRLSTTAPSPVLRARHMGQDRSSQVRASVTDAHAVGEHMSSLASAGRRVSDEALAQRLARGMPAAPPGAP
jgi:hypothetical protein